MNPTLLTQYANALVHVGANVQKSDGVWVQSDTECLPLLREVVKACWKAGAKDVQVDIADNDLTLIKYEYADKETFEEIPARTIENRKAMLADDYCTIGIRGPNPELLKNVDKEKLRISQRASALARKPLEVYYDSGRVKWLVATCPTKAWSKLVFPDLPEEEALEKLWEAVLSSARIDENAVENWQTHNAILKKRAAWLNEQGFAKMHYQAPGTDLWVGLAESAVWLGGASTTPSGVDYIPNMPTEEIFSCPHLAKVDDTLKATKPLSLSGTIVDGMEFVFENGKVTQFTAEQNTDVLENMMEQDEGARRLGEIAIVPHSSPISQTGLLFMNTLFDENASCHFALGSSYAETIVNGEKMTSDERKELGANQSAIHIDFMVGSDKLNITGYTKDEKEIPVLINGDFNPEADQ